MKMPKKMMITCCASFTTVAVLYALFSMLIPAFPQPSAAIILQLFGMCFCIALLMCAQEFIENKCNINSLLLDGLLRLGCIYIGVYAVGVPFGFLDFSLKCLGLVSLVAVPAFIATYAAVYLISTHYAQSINEALKKRRQNAQK